MFDDEFMNDMLLNPDLYDLDNGEESRQNREIKVTNDDKKSSVKFPFKSPFASPFDWSPFYSPFD